MTVDSPQAGRPQYSLKLMLKAWLLVGTLDILAALLQFYIQKGKDPSIVLQYIASAVFGGKAFTGGYEVWGLFFHYLIALFWTLLFFVLYTRIKLMRKSIFLTALVYGILIWVTMTRLILPITKVPVSKAPFDLIQALIAIGILVFAIGLPLAIIARKKESRSVNSHLQ